MTLTQGEHEVFDVCIIFSCRTTQPGSVSHVNSKVLLPCLQPPQVGHAEDNVSDTPKELEAQLPPFLLKNAKLFVFPGGISIKCL